MRRDVRAFCDRYGLRVPVLQAPMAGSCPPELGIAVAGAGGMGAAGVLLDPPDRIARWVDRFRAGSTGALQLDPAYVRRLHEHGIAWFACATTLDDALAAQEAGADAVVAQGMEAGGHRGTVDPGTVGPGAAERTDVGLFALLPTSPTAWTSRSSPPAASPTAAGWPPP